MIISAVIVKRLISQVKDLCFFLFQKEPNPKVGIYVLNNSDVWLPTSFISQNDHFTKIKRARWFGAMFAFCGIATYIKEHLRQSKYRFVSNLDNYICHQNSILSILLTCGPCPCYVFKPNFVFNLISFSKTAISRFEQLCEFLDKQRVKLASLCMLR